MGKKSARGKRHLKRKPAPRFWPIHRKEYVWTVKPKPGPHSISHSVPLAIIIRDILGFAKTRKEAKTIVSKGNVLIDGKVRREDTFPAGLMDVITIPEAEAIYRILPHKKGLILHPIEKDEAMFKLCRIENKIVVDHGHVQLNLHDGTNRIIQVADAKSLDKDVYQTLNILKINIPDSEIVEQMKLEKNAAVLIIGGKNRAKNGKIVNIEEARGKKRRLLRVTVEDVVGKHFQTILDFVFVIGKGDQTISLPEVI